MTFLTKIDFQKFQIYANPKIAAFYQVIFELG